VCCCAFPLAIAGQQGASGRMATNLEGSLSQRVDAVFAKRVSTNSPGCAVSIVQNGSPLYQKAYGMANLEWELPNTLDTVFDIGSVSKQFTAFSILLLARDGKLSVDDDIRKYLPEIPNYGQVIRIRHLLNHTSGLRNYTDLFDLAGVPEIDLTGDQDALDLVVRQKNVNFAPGDEFLYSDTNYFLASLIVKRVTGKSLRQFAKERIFEPLGMNSTHFHDDHTMIVPHRATGYKPLGGGSFAIDMSNFEELGDGSVMTTVADLGKWDENFYTGKVGGMEVIRQMHEPGRLNDGTTNLYAKGLVVDRYRGQLRVQHAGEWVGYRAGLTRYPEQKTSFITLCNTIGEVFPTNLNQSLADIVLRHAFAATTLEVAGGDSKASDSAGRYAGAYWNSHDGLFRHFVEREGKLYREDEGDLYLLQPDGPGRFKDADSGTSFQFDNGDGTRLATVQERQEEGEHYTLAKVADIRAGQSLSEYEGDYVSDDLDTQWSLAVRDGALVRVQKLNPDQVLRPAFVDAFTGDLSEDFFLMHFRRDSAGHVTGFDVSTEMIHPNLSFKRVPASH
jgi:CubicO group peptidase (beta-lactamase class C family)